MTEDFLKTNSQIIGFGVRAANRELVRADSFCQFNSSCIFNSLGKGSVLRVRASLCIAIDNDSTGCHVQIYNQILANLTVAPMAASACINTTSCFSPVTARDFQESVQLSVSKRSFLQ